MKFKKMEVGFNQLKEGDLVLSEDKKTSYFIYKVKKCNCSCGCRNTKWIKRILIGCMNKDKNYLEEVEGTRNIIRPT